MTYPPAAQPPVACARFTFAAEAASVGQARRAVRATLADWGLDHLQEAAVLLTSELATNAVLHAQTPLLVQLDRRPGTLQITVADDSELPARRRSHGVHAGTGRGLPLVAALARSTGTQAPFGDYAKGVWFQLSDQQDVGPTSPEGAIYGVDWPAVASP